MRLASAFSVNHGAACFRDAGFKLRGRYDEGICLAECVLRPLIAWLRSSLGFDFSPEVNDGESSGAECGEGAVLA